MRPFVLHGKNELTKIRARAMRRGIWFSALTRAERAQMELTIRVVKRIRSYILAKVVSTIVKKLLNAMESKVARLTRRAGQLLAENLSKIGQSWGNKSSIHWKRDLGFARYLAVSYMNTPAIFEL